MGGGLSTPSPPSPSTSPKENPNKTPTRTTMSASPKTPEPESPATSETLETQKPDQKSTDPSLIEENKEFVDEIDEDEEEQGECGFCLFMKGGDCKEVFINWEKCIESAEKNNEDIANKCFDVTSALKECMEAHPDYYGPILRAEKAAQEEAITQLEKEKEKEKEAMAASNSGEGQTTSDLGEKQQEKQESS